ncbi:MAG TPA: hypothetical protein DCP28_11330 [Cytophagales bacterium]|nr:hypothetical protein [Cytophagales bacterium]
MVELKEGLTAVSQRRANLRLNYQWMGRFSHQHTSQFHRDSAHPHSFLMLGYEPTAVDSRVYVADFSKLIEQHGIPLATYFGGSQEVNVAAEAPSIAPYVTELTPFPKDHYRLLVLNNSKSFQKPTFGMFHRGEVQQKQSAEDRIINSIMLYMANPEEEEQHTQQDISNFVNTQQVNR